MAEKEVDVVRAKVPLASHSPNSVQKVIVQLKATADAPILKQNKFKILGTDKFAKVIEFLRRQLHRETVFVYINSAFSPNPDELVIDLLNKISSTSKGNIICEETEEWEAGCVLRIQQAGRLRQLMNF